MHIPSIRFEMIMNGQAIQAIAIRHRYTYTGYSGTQDRNVYKQSLTITTITFDRFPAWPRQINQ